MTDAKVKPWAPVNGTKVGSILIPDNGFCCMEESIAVVVRENKDGLYVPCREGRHGLDGQISKDGTEYVGLWCSPVTVDNFQDEAKAALTA